MELRLVMAGASELDFRRGIAAAVSVFEKSSMHPLRAADGFWELEGWDIRGFPEDGISDEDDEAASVWIDAEMAAIEAANQDRPKEQHLSGTLELILAPEEKEQLRGERDEIDEEEESLEAAILAKLKENGYPPPP